MNTTRGLSAVAAWGVVIIALLTAPETPDATGDEKEIKAPFGYKEVKNPRFPYSTLVEPVVLSGEDLPLPVIGGVPKISISKDQIAIDRNRDGKSDEVVRKPGKVVQFNLQEAGQKGYKYALYIFKCKQYERWLMRPACYITGNCAGVPVTIFDSSANGKYNDFGEDSMIVGRGSHAIPLSRMMSTGRKLYKFDIDEAGTLATLTPYTGKTGKLDLYAGYRGSKKPDLLAAGNGVWIFDFASAPGGITVPIGTYQFKGAILQKGQLSCKGRTGLMDAFRVEEDKATRPVWGAPFRLEIEYWVAAGMVRVSYDKVTVWGSANEEYYDFEPEPIFPSVEVRNANTGKTIAKGKVQPKRVNGQLDLQNTEPFATSTKGNKVEVRISDSVYKPLFGATYSKWTKPSEKPQTTENQ